ncbi:MAG: C50 family peptidase [Asgard group archaeon]|nr:C50 family peptidase [Asgard group archaeon]
MDNKVLDQKLVSYLASNSIAIPLSPSKSTNIPKFDIKSLESSCISSLSSLLSSNIQLDTFDSIQLRLQGLYLIYNNDRNKFIGILRKHQLFIVKLFELKQINVVFNQLKILSLQIKKMFGIVDLDDEEDDGSGIYKGIPVINTDNDEIIQLVVAYHFLLLQCIAQYSSKNLKSIVTRSDPFIDLKTFQNIPRLFLKSSNIRRWQLLTNKDDKKFNGNTIKLLQGFIRLFEGIKTHKYQILANCLKIKLVEFTKDKSLLKSIGECSELLPFINDSDPEICQLFTKPNNSLRVMDNELHMKLLRSPPDLINDVEFLKSLKSLSLSYDSCGAIIQYFNDSKDEIKQLLNFQLSILDSITIFIKNSLSQQMVPLLSQLFIVYNHFKQLKRMRNVSNLLYNLGNKLQNNDYWNLSIEYECDIMDILPTDDNFKCLFSKLGKPVMKGSTFVKFLQALEKYDKLDKLIIQFISKSLLTNPELLLNNITDEFKCELVLEIFKTLEKTTNSMQKTLICNSIISSLEWTNQELECKVLYSYYNINGLDNYLDLDIKDSKNSLIISGFQFQKLVNFQWSQVIFKQCLDNFESWLANSNTTDITSFEWEISKQVLLYVKFNGVTGWLVRIIELFLEVKSAIPIEYQFFLKFEYCNGLLKLSQESKLSTVLLEFNQVAKSWKSISDVLKLSLLQFDYYIQTNNLTKSKERYTGILTTLKRKPEFNMATSSELPLIQKFNNFLIIGKFQLLSSKLNQKLHKPIDAYVNVKTSIQILYSILKKCPNNVLRSSSQELIWEIYQLLSDSYKFIIELSIELGISRNIPFYLHEWEKLLDGVENPIVNCIHYTDIGNYGSRMNSDEFVECIQKAQECSRISKEYHEMDNANGFKDTLITCMKQELANCIEDISSITSLHNLTDSVQFLPGLLGESNAPCPKEILDRLVGLKNQIIQELSQSNLPLPKGQRLVYILNQTVSILSSLASFKGGDLLSELYYLQDQIKNYPFANEYKIMKYSNKKDLLPIDIPNDVQKNMLDFNVDLLVNLPRNWIIVTLDICQQTGDLLLSKRTKDSNPVFIRLPLNRFKNGVSPMNFETMKKELENIIEESNLSTKKATTSKIITVEDRKQWWRSRFTLDYELQDILNHVEQYWIGGFVGIFENYQQDNVFLKFKQDFIKILKSCISKQDKSIEFNDEIIKCIFAMNEYNRESIDDLAKYLINSLKFHGYLIDQFKFDKFHEFMKSLIDKYKGLKFKSSSNQHIVLIPSSKCLFFPWESLNFLKNKSISRMPSVSMLIDRLNSSNDLKIDTRELYYLINPSGDLKRTEERFRNYFIKNSYWKGIIGEKPNEDKIIQDILKNNLFIYIGHGGCDQYIKVNNLFKSCNSNEISLPPSLLLGCSSGKLEDNGEFEPLGNIFNWLTCKSSMILVNLWDVTDKDIDKFTISLFENWGLIESTNNIEKGQDFTNSIIKSRYKCTLKNLNGSAPIVYGLPLILN